MKRSTFMTISAVIAGAFSLTMLFAPQMFTQGIMTQPPTQVVNICFQFLGTNLFAIAVINMMARKSAWSPALRGILAGNIVLHTLAIVTDYYAYSQHAITMNGVIQGLVVHLVFIIGFGYYVMKPSPFEKTVPAGAR